jgi:hypothetical protein
MLALDEPLRNAILAHCLYMEDDGLESLGRDVAHGSLAWFPAEFAAAIRAGVFTPELWGRLTETGLDDDETDQLDEDLRRVWAHAAPGQPYPLDA